MESVIAGVVGTLQFDVLEQRLKSEYHVGVRRQPLGYTDIRWIANEPGDVDWAIEHNPDLELSEFGNVSF